MMELLLPDAFHHAFPVHFPELDFWNCPGDEEQHRNHQREGEKGIQGDGSVCKSSAVQEGEDARHDDSAAKVKKTFENQHSKKLFFGHADRL